MHPQRLAARVEEAVPPTTTTSNNPVDGAAARAARTVSESEVPPARVWHVDEHTAAPTMEPAPAPMAARGGGPMLSAANAAGSEGEEPPFHPSSLPLDTDEFPDEVLAVVCRFLSVLDLRRLARVSRRFTEPSLSEPGHDGSGGGDPKLLSPIEEGARLQLVAKMASSDDGVFMSSGTLADLGVQTWLHALWREEYAPFSLPFEIRDRGDNYVPVFVDRPFLPNSGTYRWTATVTYWQRVVVGIACKESVDGQGWLGSTGDVWVWTGNDPQRLWKQIDSPATGTFVLTFVLDTNAGKLDVLLDGMPCEPEQRVEAGLKDKVLWVVGGCNDHRSISKLGCPGWVSGV
jgi:hypothetical protein